VTPDETDTLDEEEEGGAKDGPDEKVPSKPARSERTTPLRELLLRKASKAEYDFKSPPEEVRGAYGSEDEHECESDK
jgi:hypothetical protein